MGNSCESHRDKSPQAVLEDLYHQFQTKYAFFKLRNVDWSSLYESHKKQLTSDTTDEKLFKVLSSMAGATGDGHVNIANGRDVHPRWVFNAGQKGERKFGDVFKDDDATEPELTGEQKYFAMVDRSLASNGFSPLQIPKELPSGIMLYSCSEHYGYLRVTQEITRDEAEMTRGILGTLWDIVVLDKLMFGQRVERGLDEAMEAFKDKKGLIFDIRANKGGFDPVSISIANRFVEQKMVAYRKEEKEGINDKGEDVFGAMQEFAIGVTGDEAVCGAGKEPGDAQYPVAFTGKPVKLLTNECTFSAGEVLALMLQPLPQVRVVGGNTHGCFSDMLEGKLCNDWLFTLSHQRYYNAQGLCFEDQGVPVDVPVQWSEDLATEDPVLLAALADFT